MPLIKRLALVLIIAFNFLVAGQLTKEYYNIKITFSQEKPLIGQELKVFVEGYYPGIEYVYLRFESGESYFLDKKGDNNWQATIVVPAYFTEGLRNAYVNFVFSVQDKKERQELKYLVAQNKETRLTETDSLLVTEIAVPLLLLEKNTLEAGSFFSVFPDTLHQGQRFIVIMEAVELIKKASVVYGGKTYPLRQEGDLKWSLELIAEQENKLKIYYVDQSGQLQHKILSLVVLPPQKYFEPPIVPVAPNEALATKEQEKKEFLIKGNKTIVFVNKSKEGEAGDFVEEHSREESLNLDISGQEGDVKVEASIFSTTQENVDKQEDIKIKLYTDTWQAYLGDFIETVSDNQFTFYNKNLSGFRFAYYPQDTYLMLLFATERGYEKEEYLYGNDSQGPYYLKNTPLVMGSETVFIDGVLQKRERDYIVEYKLGKITFRNNVVRKQQLIRVVYEVENSTYKSNYTAGRFKYDFENVSLGLTFLNKRDPLEQDLLYQGLPKEKKLYSLDTSLRLGYLCLEIEQARSEVDEDISNASTTVNRAEAQYGKLSYDDGRILSFAASAKKTEDDFEAIGNTDLKKGLNENTQEVEFNVSQNLIIRGDHYLQEYREEAFYKNERGLYKFYAAESFLPEVRYLVNERRRSVEELTSENYLEKTYFRSETVELSKSLTENFRIGVRGGLENNEDIDQFYVSQRAKSYGAFIKTEKLSAADFILGVDRQDSEYLDEDQLVTFNASRDETYTRLNIYPDSRFRSGLEYRNIRDTYEGNSEIVELDYLLAPSYKMRAIGQYQLSSLKEQFVSEDYRVRKQKGSFSLRWNPVDYLRTNFKYNPNVSIVELEREQVDSYAEVRNVSLDYAYFSCFNFKYNYLYSWNFAKEMVEVDNFRLQSEDRLESDNYLLRFFPHEKIDMELKYTHIDKLNTNINDTNTSNVYYAEGLGYETRKGLSFYSRLTRKILLTLDFTQEYEIMEYENEPSVNIEDLRNIAGFDTRYNLNRNWTFHLFGTFAKNENLLVSKNNITYEMAPGAGFTFKIINLKFSYDYTMTKSLLEGDSYDVREEYLRHKHSAGISYDLSHFINFIVNAEHINSERPYYKTTDVLAKLSASF